MKKDIGKRTYKEMYLITKEERSILEKCTTNLDQNPKTDLLSKMKNVEKQLKLMRQTLKRLVKQLLHQIKIHQYLKKYLVFRDPPNLHHKA